MLNEELLRGYSLCSRESLDVACDLKISKKCKSKNDEFYKTSVNNINKVRKKYDKDVCFFCAKVIKKNGRSGLKPGDIFGKLTLISWIEAPACQWKVKCKCGKVINARSNSLKSGRHKSCGCDRARPNKRLPDDLALKRKAINNCIRNAVKRGILYELEESFILGLFSKNCIYCNAEPNNLCLDQTKKRIFKYSGIDRVDNSLGYIPSNCVPCCSQCNRAKSDLSLEEWEKWIINLHKYTIVQK